MLTYNNSDKGNMIRESCFIHLFTHVLYIFILRIRILQNIEDVHMLIILIYLGNMNNHKWQFFYEIKP